MTETVRLLAALAPKLNAALRAAGKAGHAFVIIDGTLIAIDWVAKDRPFYSGKHHRHGMNLRVISSADGEILWVSSPLPGAVHDLTAARIWGILLALAAAGLITLADKGYIGADQHVLVPYPGPGQARLTKGRQSRPRPPARPRRERGQRRGSPHLAQAPMLPLARRPHRQGHPCPPDPRTRRMKKAH